LLRRSAVAPGAYPDEATRYSVQQPRQLGEVRGKWSRSKRGSANGRQFSVDWKPISTAPYAGDLELAVIEKDGPHPVAFPCRRVVGGWIAAETNKWIKVRPTHWRVWPSPVEKP